MKYLGLILISVISTLSGCGSTCEDDIPVGPSYQLVQNGGFELFDTTSNYPIQNWTAVNCPVGDTGLTINKGYAYSGNASLGLTTNMCGVETKLNIPDNASKYTIAVQSQIMYYTRTGQMSAGCPSQCARITLVWLSDNGTVVDTHVHYVGPFDTNGTIQWKLESFVGSIPTKASTVVLELRRTSSGSNFRGNLDDVVMVVQ